ncbi:MAG TPA: hypothetical protein VLH80_07400 [Nitrospiraceae bacterium]|nr:hypothetical protein [Nitrospiraceae bacterium]
MANVNAPSGFRVAKHQGGGTANRRTRYHIAGAYGSAIAVGDAVEQTTTSKNIIRPGAATDRLSGVFDGCFYLDPNQSAPQYNRLWPAAQAVVAGSTVDAWVYDDPHTIFEAQMSLAFALSYIGALANLVSGTENTTIKISNDAVDSTTAAGNTGVVFRIEDIVNRPDNIVGNYARVLVTIALHYLSGAQTGI